MPVELPSYVEETYAAYLLLALPITTGRKGLPTRSTTCSSSASTSSTSGG